MDFSVLKDNLIKLGYEVSVFETAAEAADYLDSEIDNTTVTFGGSVTLDELGLYDRLDKHNEVFWHWKIKENQSPTTMREFGTNTDVYVSSVNGIAETGEIINIDATGNRVASMTYGHRKLYLVIGENKVAKDYDAALYRARNIASPLNAKRLNKKTPCAVNADKCYNCNSPERICRALSVFWCKPIGQAVEVVLINEKLGY